MESDHWRQMLRHQCEGQQFALIVVAVEGLDLWTANQPGGNLTSVLLE